MYKVRARIQKRWFKPDRMVYDVLHHYQEWDDPSYGNGGGDFVDRVRRVGTFKGEMAATLACRDLNKYSGEKDE